MHRVNAVLSLLLAGAVLAPSSAASPALDGVRLGCGLTIVDASAWRAASQAAKAAPPVDLTSQLERLRAGRPGDGEHRLHRTESGMTISVRLEDGRVAAYVVDRKASVEYHDRDNTDEYPYEDWIGPGGSRPPGSECGPGEEICVIRIEDEDGVTYYWGCCTIIML